MKDLLYVYLGILSDLPELWGREWKMKRSSNFLHQLGSVQSLSHVRLFASPWIAACQASLSIRNSWSSLRLTSIESVMPSSHLILCRPPAPNPSHHQSFPMSQLFAWSGQSTGVSALVSIIPSQEIPGLISFRKDWLGGGAKMAEE